MAIWPFALSFQRLMKVRGPTQNFDGILSKLAMREYS
jgi:hypothetical protein